MDIEKELTKLLALVGEVSPITLRPLIQIELTRLIDEIKTDNSLKEVVWDLSNDMHEVSSRGCRTCEAMSEAFGKPFGCVAYRNKSKIPK